MKSFVPLLVAAVAAAVLAPVSVSAPPTRSVSATPTSIDFGTVAMDESAVRTVTLTNTGRTRVWVWGWGVEGAFSLGGETGGEGPCSLVYIRPGGAFLPPGKSCTFSVEAGIRLGVPPGTYVGAFIVWGEGGQEDELVRIPLTVTIV